MSKEKTPQAKCKAPKPETPCCNKPEPSEKKVPTGSNCAHIGCP